MSEEGVVNLGYKLTQQTLIISSINFHKQTISGYVEFQLALVGNSVSRVVLNCRHARLYRVVINNHRTVNFHYADPTLLVCPDSIKQRNLDYFCGAYTQAIEATSFDLGNGELIFEVPSDLFHEISTRGALSVRVDFSLETPEAGVHFVTPESFSSDPDGGLYERGVHMFTYAYENCNKLWFPHIDSPSMPCLWHIEVTVPKDLTAVVSGDLTDVVFSEENNTRTFIYQLNIPTCAYNLGIAVGAFEVHPDPDMYEMTHFCPPGLGELLLNTVSPTVHEIIEYLEQLLSNRFPFATFKTVFVDEAYTDFMCFSSLVIFDVGLLHSDRIIDQVPKTMRLFANAISEQLFGCFISMSSWSDSWAVYGIGRFLALQYCKETFGKNEHAFLLRQASNQVCDYEESEGEIILDNSIAVCNTHKSNNMDACRPSPCLMSPSYVHIHKLKAMLIVRLISERVGPEVLIQVFNKVISLAVNASKQSFESWTSMQMNTNSLINSVGTLCGKDLTDLIKMWVFNGGHPSFTVSYNFNKKRNCIELELRQQEISSSKKGLFRYVGPLNISLQELDGPFTHTLNVEELISKHDIGCHAKSRRLKKKKIPMSNGEEIDMNFSTLDPDVPVLWLRVDPTMLLLCRVKLEMQDLAWQFMLRYEKNAIAQLDAVESLQKFDCQESRLALLHIIESTQVYYRVRTAAIHSLTAIATKYCRNWSSTPTILDLGKKLFGSNACPELIRSNDFTNLEEYFLQTEFLSAVSKLRNSQNMCPEDVVKYILEAAIYNDNRSNGYSDSQYKAAIINALSQTVTTSATIVSQPDLLTPMTRKLVEEVTKYLNMEKLLPSYKMCITVSCLKAIRNLQRFGHLPNDPTVFKPYCSPNQFSDVRLAAIEALIDFTRDDANSYILGFLMDIIESDRAPYVRHRTLGMLAASPPFDRTDANPLNTEATVDRLWNLLNRVTVADARLRCSAIEFYHALYGRNRPYCLPKPELGVVVNLKERRADVTRGETAALKPGADVLHSQMVESTIDSLNITVEEDTSDQKYISRLSLSSNEGGQPSGFFGGGFDHDPPSSSAAPGGGSGEYDDVTMTSDHEGKGEGELSPSAGGITHIQCVPDEEFHADRQPMYLPPSFSQPGTEKSKKRKKEKKQKKKKKHSSRDDVGLSGVNSSSLGGGGGGGSDLRLSPPSSPGSSN